jgi:hypothetical protein
MDPISMDRKEYLRSLALLTVPVALAACGVPQGTVPVKVRVVFSEPMDQDSVESAANLLVGAVSQEPVSVTWENGTTALFDFGNLSQADLSSFNLGVTACDLAGNPLDAFTQVYA